MLVRRDILVLLGVLSIGLLAVSCGAGAGAPPTPTPPPTATPPTPTATAPAASEATATTAPARTFQIVPEESEARYEVEEEFLQGAVDRLGLTLGENTAVGLTNAIEGSFTFVPGSPPQLESGTFEVDLRTLESDEFKRDERLRDRYFDAFPLAEFTATEIENLPADYEEGQTANFQLVGDMTFFGKTRPLTFDTRATMSGDTITGTATTVMFTEDYGMPAPSIFGIIEVTDGVTVTVDFTARAEGAAG